MCLSSLRFTLKLNCSGKENSPSVSNDSKLAWGVGLHSARDQEASSNDARGAQSALGGRIWERLLAHILHRGCKPFKPVTTETTQSLAAADSFSSRVLLQQCLYQT